jgi:hypothetical protein
LVKEHGEGRQTLPVFQEYADKGDSGSMVKKFLRCWLLQMKSFVSQKPHKIVKGGGQRNLGRAPTLFITEKKSRKTEAKAPSFSPCLPTPLAKIGWEWCSSNTWI